jgi:hypothetical protein
VDSVAWVLDGSGLGLAGVTQNALPGTSQVSISDGFVGNGTIKKERGRERMIGGGGEKGWPGLPGITSIASR